MVGLGALGMVNWLLMGMWLGVPSQRVRVRPRGS